MASKTQTIHVTKTADEERGGTRGANREGMARVRVASRDEGAGRKETTDMVTELSMGGSSVIIPSVIAITLKARAKVGDTATER